MKLMIVESPNKVKKIKSILDALGRGSWEVAASVGHIRDLPIKELGIALPDYTPIYELTERGRDVVKRLKMLASRAEEIYLATDPDREGEAISWHLKEALGRGRYQRVTFDAITPSVITRALGAPRAIDDNLVQAQEARRVLDRLVGYQVSPVLSRQTGRTGLSAGRVQSPAVRLVVDREREIAAFVETKHFGAEVSFEANAWRAQWETAPFLPKGEKYLMDRALAERAAACRSFLVESSENRQASQPPPPPFTTSTLLQAASVSLGLKPDVTAQLAQKLFEAGLITYHRTDSQNFSAEAIKEVRSFAAGRKLPLPASGRHFKARGGAQEAHEAIRPTHFPAEQAGEDRLQQALYRLIWQRAVASQLADAVYSVNTLKLVAQGEAGLALASAGDADAKVPARRFPFKAIGRTLVEAGWKALTARDEAEEEEPARDGDSENCGRVPLLAAGRAAQAESGRVLLKQTRPPSRYTQASLIKKLESIGIGRPSTYPAILKNVLTRAYLEEDRKFLLPTELGCLVVDTLEPRFRFLDYTFTRELEQQLDDIAEGKAHYLDVVAGADAQLQQELARLNGAPAGRSAIRRPAPDSTAQGPASLPALRGSSRGVASRRTPPTNKAANQAAAEAEREPRRGASSASPARSSARKRPARSKTLDESSPVTGTGPASNKRTSSARSTRQASTSAPAPGPRSGRTKPSAPHAPASRAAPVTSTHGPAHPAAPLPCPRCKQGALQLSADSRRYSCDRMTCGLSIQATIAGRRMKPADLKELGATGRTSKLTGFLSKTGRPFEAALVLAENGRIEFSFTPR